MQGFNTRRHTQNPKEKELHDKFADLLDEGNISNNAVDKMVFGTTDYGDARDYLSDREKQIVISTIQWLGSPIGQGFLRDSGFKLIK